MGWNNSTLITGDLGEYVADLKRKEGPEIQVHGSPGLIQTLLENDLIDEFRVWIFPVVIGTGKRLFGDGAHPAALKLIDSKVSKTGVTTTRTFFQAASSSALRSCARWRCSRRSCFSTRSRARSTRSSSPRC